MRILGYVLPVIGHILSMTARKLVTFIDAAAGPGGYGDNEDEQRAGSPVLLYNAAIALVQESRLFLIEREASIYDRLLRFVLQLPTVEHTRIVPVFGDCQDHLARIVETADDDPVVIFFDPCGYQMPNVLPQLAARSNVTLLLRYSLVAANRQIGPEKLQRMLSKLRMPFWGCNLGDVGGLHKYSFVLGTHEQQITAACSRVMPTIASADAAVSQQLTKYASTATPASRPKRRKRK